MSFKDDFDQWDPKKIFNRKSHLLHNIHCGRLSSFIVHFTSTPFQGVYRSGFSCRIRFSRFEVQPCCFRAARSHKPLKKSHYITMVPSTHHPTVLNWKLADFWSFVNIAFHTASFFSDNVTSFFLMNLSFHPKYSDVLSTWYLIISLF